ncbi:hypothetical protein Tco_1059375 [Tanacetum coccineum]
MDDPNITMEEYIRLEEEKARKHGKVFKWETAKYGKIWYDEDIHDLRPVETKFPAISFNDEVSSKTLSRKPMVSSLNDEIDFRVSFYDSDDEDYTIWHLYHLVIKDTYGFVIRYEQELAERMRMVYTRDDGQEIGGARRSMTWRQFILALGLHTTEEMAKDGFGPYWLRS